MGVMLYIIMSGWKELFILVNMKWLMFIQSFVRLKFKVNDVLMLNEFMNNFVLQNYQK